MMSAREFIKVLSYNIYWKAMTGKEKVCNKKRCLINVIKLIKKYRKSDFISLQEASKWKTIYKKAKLKHMGYINYKPKDEEIVTFWDKKKYTLEKYFYGKLNEKNKNKICGESTGRIFQILFFKEGICFINLHAGHSCNSIKNIESKLIKALKKHKINMSKYRVILTGDFNKTHPNKIKLLNKKLYQTKSKKTCCSGKLINYGHTSIYDQTFDSKSRPITYILNPKTPASDHLPILSFMKK